MAELFLNAGYRYVSQPTHVSVFHLAKDVPLGFGITIPRSARIQLIAESTADVSSVRTLQILLSAHKTRST